jgi:AraC-like DNA-binding protein
LHLFCSLAIDELPAPTVSLQELLGAEGRRLAEALEEAPDWESRFDLLDAAIDRRFAAARAPTPSIEWAWRALAASAGRVEIGSLSDRIGCSHRHLIAGFREQVGVPPTTPPHEAGGEIAVELTDTDYGSRDFTVRDPEGNLWAFGTYRPG